MKRYHHPRLPDPSCHAVREYTYLPIMRHSVVQRDADTGVVPQCSGWGTDLSDKGLRIGSIFIILTGSMLGVFLPMLLARTSPNSRHSKLLFFVCKYFGSGVILATAFMHLLSPAVEALSDECLANILPAYDWGHVICLATIMVMFYIELMAMRFNFNFGHSSAGGHSGHSHGGPSVSPSDLSKKTDNHGDSHGHEHGNGQAKLASGRTTSLHSVRSVNGNTNINNGTITPGMTEWRQSVNNSALSGLAAYATANLERNDRDPNHEPDLETGTTSMSLDSASSQNKKEANGTTAPAPEVGVLAPVQTQNGNGGLPSHLNYPPGNEDHLAHDHDHVNGDSHGSYGSQIVSLLILEFGVVFHSLFIGLSLAGSDNLKILLIVIAFHQFFEGLGLGSRLAVASWPSNWKAWTGYLMAVGYGVTTPIGIAIGLGVNAGLNSRPDLSQLVNGIFDAVSSGILVYTALVELLAHEFMFNPEMRDAKLSVQMLAFLCVAVGVGLMSLLAKWA